MHNVSEVEKTVSNRLILDRNCHAFLDIEIFCRPIEVTELLSQCCFRGSILQCHIAVIAMNTGTNLTQRITWEPSEMSTIRKRLVTWEVFKSAVLPVARH